MFVSVFALVVITLTTDRLRLLDRATDVARCVARDDVSRRDAAQLAALVLGTGPVLLATGRADASSNPANSYYFPMAKYRYLPRINRAYTSLADAAAIEKFAAGDWSALSVIYANADDATTALALYANSVEGSRSSKGKRKSQRQKQLYVFTDDYKTGVEKLGKAVRARSAADVVRAVSISLAALQSYKDLADINGENAVPPEVPLDQQKYIAVFKGGGYKNEPVEGRVIIPLR